MESNQKPEQNEEEQGEYLDIGDVDEVFDGDGDGEAEGDVDGEAEDGDDALEMDENKRQALQDQLNNMLENDDSVQGFFGHEDSIFCVALSRTGTLAATGDGNDRAIIWDYSTGEKKHELVGHTDSVIAIKFSSDDQLLATGSMDSTVRIWRVSDGALAHALEGPSADIEWLDWHPSGHVVVAGSVDATTWMWNADNAQCMRVFSGHLGPVTAGRFLHDGKTLLTASEDGSVMAYAPKTGEATMHIKNMHDAPITSFSVHPTQRFAITGGADGVAKIINLDSSKVLVELKGHTDSIEGCEFAPNHKLAATVSVDGKAKIWDLNTGHCRVTCEHDDSITCVQWHPSLPVITTASMDATVRQWDALSGECTRTWRGHQEGVICFAQSSDGNTIVSGGDDRTALVFKRDQTKSNNNNNNTTSSSSSSSS